jgi:ABC-type molybdate transport system substrate-binding protein
MTFRQRVRVSLVCIAAALAIITIMGCAQKPEPGQPKVRRDPNLLVVYAACSLQPAVEAAKTQFISQNAGKSADLVIDEPAKLVERVRGGAVPDIVIVPGEVEIGALVSDGFLDGASREAFGGMRVVIMVPRGNPGNVHQPDSLLGSSVRTIAIPTPGLTSAGSDAKRELERAKLWSRLQDKLSFTPTPLAALQAVSKRKVDAAVLYDPCIRLKVGNDVPADSVEPISTLTPESERGTRVYAIQHKQSPNALLARRFLTVLAAQEQATPAPAAGSSPAETPQTSQ